MAKNTGGSKKDNLKRDFVKYLRDGIKAQYIKAECCQICSSTEDLELHHYHSVTAVYQQYLIDNNLPEPQTEDEVFKLREQIYAEHQYELVEDTVTLCVEDHRQLHKIYGVVPLLSTASAQRNWVKIQNEKAHNKDSQPATAGRFSKFKC